MRAIVLTCLMVMLTLGAIAQSGSGFRKNYRLLHSDNITTDKNFYLFTVLGYSSELQQVFMHDTLMLAIGKDKAAFLKRPKSTLFMFKWSESDSVKTCRELEKLYALHIRLFDRIINGQLRPSGCYEGFKKLDNLKLLLKAWGSCMAGINHIIDHYGYGKGMRYPAIDSASYDVHSADYVDLTKTMFSYLDERIKNKDLFYQPSLSAAMQLMALNNRDEPGRFEPLEKGENRSANFKAGQTNWKKFPYSAIMVPGEGLEDGMRSLSPLGKMRCDLAADRYLQKKAPFIIVSGGFVHPFQTPYCEAFEMKKYLLAQYHVPVSAIIIEPQARHTTTNFRNAERLMIRYGFPINQPALCVTTKDQADYIENRGFDKRNLRELGYLPYDHKKRLGDHDTSFLPVLESLQIDPVDPLDP